MFRLLLIVLFLNVFLGFGQAQKDSVEVQLDNSYLNLQEINDDNLQAYREDAAFDYIIKKADLTWWDNFLNWLENLLLRFFEWLFGVGQAAEYLASFLRLIPYILIGILLFILIKFFLKVNATSVIYSRKNQPTEILTEDEHIIKNEDIDQLLNRALAKKDFRLAIRYYYLLLLKLLGQKEYIDWEPQKTNLDYVNELKRKDLKTHFGQITRLYDYIWYGGFIIDETNYLKAEAPFSKLKKTLEDNA